MREFRDSSDDWWEAIRISVVDRLLPGYIWGDSVELYFHYLAKKAGITFEAMPRVSGRDLSSLDRPRSFNRWTIIGAGGVMLSLVAAGLVSGFSWVAGSNSLATSPPSWSIEIRPGISAPVVDMTSWMPLERPAACSGLSTLCVQAK